MCVNDCVRSSIRLLQVENSSDAIFVRREFLFLFGAGRIVHEIVIWCFPDVCREVPLEGLNVFHSWEQHRLNWLSIHGNLQNQQTTRSRVSASITLCER